MGLLQYLGDNWSTLGPEVRTQFQIVAISMIVAAAIGVTLGVVAARSAPVAVALGVASTLLTIPGFALFGVLAIGLGIGIRPTEAEARRTGIAVKTVEYDVGNVAGASLYADGYSGHAKLVVDDRRRVVLGATFLGPNVGELLHAATIAVVSETPLDRLWHAVPAYPTISEIWLRLLETYGL